MTIFSPERALMLAVLEDAIRCFADERRTRSGRRRRRAREAEAWLFADDHAWPFSFVNVCAVFDLSPSAVRAALRGGPADARRPLSKLRLRMPPRRRTRRVGAIAS
jgi:hypothetical protein